MRKSLHFRMRARLTRSEKKQGDFQRISDEHKEVAITSHRGKNRTFHDRSIIDHQNKQKEAHEKAAQAKNPEEKAKWDKIRKKHIACSEWHLDKLFPKK